ncbi:MAG: hypothetical protein ACRCXB_16120 [Aeromonadaceae bacterium]
MADRAVKERRRQQRRQQADRRLEIRWEPDKEDRREGDGRRQEDIGPLNPGDRDRFNKPSL